MEPAQLEWRDGAPHAPRFGDSYFSTEGGLDESRAVFLAGCGLPGAWAGRPSYCVGELGFGTGLNALALWDAWRRTRAPGQRLVMVSVEAFPLSADDAARSLAAFPEVADLASRLLAQWPAPAPGAHLMTFPEDQFTLIVVHDEAGAALDNIEGKFDAWFLDGFAPARNPQMWRPELFARIAALSAPGAHAATFTVAGVVRRALAAAGFTAEKRPGFGRKRERLEARLGDAPIPRQATDPFPRGAPVEGEIFVLGAGIAGCALAYALRARGRDVSLIAAGPAASLPPAALLTPRLENADRPHQRALFAAFGYAAGLYDRLGVLTTRGARRLAADAAEAARLSSIAGLWPGLEPAADGVRIPAGGVLDPARALSALAGDTPRIEARVAAIEREGGQWRLQDADGRTIAQAPVLILAPGAGASGFSLLASLGLGLSAGQVSLHRAMHPPSDAVSWGGFAAPAFDRVIVGTTHDATVGDAPPPPDGVRAAALADDANRRLPGALIDPRPGAIWTGVRAVTADRLPCAGPAPVAEPYRRAWGAAARGGLAPAPAEADAAYPPGLFALAGLGSRGFAHAPLLAELIASDICGEPAPLEAAARRSLHPARFLWRALRRG